MKTREEQKLEDFMRERAREADAILERMAKADTIEEVRTIAQQAKAEGHEVTFFSCGGPKPTCYRCGARATKACDADAGNGKACGRHLCEVHARGTRCAQHAPEVISRSMPRPPRR